MAPTATRNPIIHKARLRSLLEQHGVPIRWTDGHLEALDRIIDASRQDVSQWVNVTDWTERKMYEFLGY